MAFGKLKQDHHFKIKANLGDSKTLLQNNKKNVIKSVLGSLDCYPAAKHIKLKTHDLNLLTPKSK